DDVTLQFTSATFSENEGSGMQALILVSRLGSVANAVQVGFATMNNTAVAPVDYITTSGSLLWTAGDSADKSFLVTINDDFIVETDEIVDLSLSSPTGGATLGTPNTATLTILNDDMPGSLRLSSATYQVDEDAGSIQITVNRVGGVGDAVSVQYDTADAGATAGADYTTASGTLMWNAGDGTDKTFDILITDDPNPETSEDVDITLSNPMGGAGLSLPTTAVLTIIDDDQPGMIQFTAANFQVNEFTAQATITVSRVGGDLGVVGVSFDTVDSTALAGTDYITASGILMWSDQDSADKQFTVDIINDFDIEGDEDLDLVLSAPTGGASLGTPSGGTLTIIDNDAPGILVLRAFSYQVNENGGMINIRVGRTNGLSGIVTVDYDTADAGATAGQDYTATSGTLMWNDIDGSDKSFDIPILDNPGVEPNEDVTITISNPTGGASTGFPSTATLTIIDDDVTLQLGSTSYLTDEGVGMITIDVTRLGDTTNPVTVDFATMDGSAVAPDDYTMTAGTLMWGASDSAPKTFDVVIIDDTMIETNETLTLSLDSPTGGATLGTPFASGLTITDNDVPGPGSIEFSSATYTAGAYADPVDIIVSRVGGSAGAVSVDYDTTDGTAMAGSDYTAAAGTLMWTDGDSADKMFQVVIIHDVLAESTEQLNLALTNPMGGATLGSPSTATLDIVEGWVKWPGNPVLTASPPTAWDDRNVGQPNVLGPASGFPTYMMWHWGEDQANTPGIGYATSPDGVNWVKLGAPVLTQGAVGDFDEDYLDGPCVVYDAPNGRFIMYYNGDNTAGVTEIGMATSADGISWTKFGLNPILGVGLPGDWDAGAVAFPCVVQDGPTWKMWYTGVDVFGPGSVIQIGYATSLDSATWTKHAGNPVMSPTGGSFDDPGVALPRVIEDGSPTFWMLYTGGVSINPVTFEKIGFALSIDGGITWSKYGDALGMPLPVLDVGPSGAWDDLLIFASAWETIAPSKMWYEGEQASTSNIAIGYATHP
ncbi:MAG: hypothetical protein O7H41_21085, partial [Planctomycetota bacterium]|nr:hypothetical protein [Planctomycetota bacterium]